MSAGLIIASKLLSAGGTVDWLSSLPCYDAAAGFCRCHDKDWRWTAALPLSIHVKQVVVFDAVAPGLRQGWGGVGERKEEAEDKELGERRWMKRK